MLQTGSMHRRPPDNSFLVCIFSITVGAEMAALSTLHNAVALMPANGWQEMLAKAEQRLMATMLRSLIKTRAALRAQKTRRRKPE